MKLIQSNIWGGKLKFQLTDYFAEQQPDILCMQEVNDLKGYEAYLFATFDELQKAGGFNYSEMAAVYSQHYMNRTMQYGNAILSRLPLNGYAVSFTEGEFTPYYDNTEHGLHARNFQHATFDSSGTPLHVINYHGAYVKGSKVGNADTERHMQQIADYVQQLVGPVIVCGDFNVTPDSKTVAILGRILRNLATEYKLTNTYTQLSHHNLVCDYIFVSEEVKVQSFAMSNALISDHAALVLEFSV